MAVTTSNGFNVVMLDPANYTPFYNYELCDQLAELGINLKLLTSQYVYDTKAFDDSHVYVENCFYRLPALIQARGVTRRLLCGIEHPFDWISVFMKLRKAQTPSVLHIQWLSMPFLDLHFLRFLKSTGVALVYTVHNLRPHIKGIQGRTSEAIDLRFYELADCLISHTNYTTSGLTTDFGISPDKVFQIPMGTIGTHHNLVIQDDARRQLGLKAGEPVVLFFGALRKGKGLEFLIRAFPSVVEQFPNAKLLIAGRERNVTADDLEFVRNEVGLSASNMITDLRFIPEELIPVYFGAADLVVYPYLEIDQSASMMLSMTLGKPAVVTNIGGLAEVVRDGINGRVVPPGDVALLANAINEMLSDRERLLQMGQRARQRAHEEYSWKKIAERTKAVYETALTSRLS